MLPEVIAVLTGNGEMGEGLGSCGYEGETTPHPDRGAMLDTPE